MAFSCVWEIDENANVLSTKFHKSVIKVSRYIVESAVSFVLDCTNDLDIFTKSPTECGFKVLSEFVSFNKYTMIQNYFFNF